MSSAEGVYYLGNWYNVSDYSLSGNIFLTIALALALGVWQLAFLKIVSGILVSRAKKLGASQSAVLGIVLYGLWALTLICGIGLLISIWTWLAPAAAIIWNVSIHHYLFMAALLFAIGFFGVIVRRNAISILMCLELMLNAVNLNFVAFNQVWGLHVTRAAFTSNEDVLSPVGQIFTIFVIIIAAAEAAVGLAIILALYRRRETVMVEDANVMRW